MKVIKQSRIKKSWRDIFSMVLLRGKEGEEFKFQMAESGAV